MRERLLTALSPRNLRARASSFMGIVLGPERPSEGTYPKKRVSAEVLTYTTQTGERTLLLSETDSGKIPFEKKVADALIAQMLTVIKDDNGHAVNTPTDTELLGLFGMDEVWQVLASLPANTRIEQTIHHQGGGNSTLSWDGKYLVAKSDVPGIVNNTAHYTARYSNPLEGGGFRQCTVEAWNEKYGVGTWSCKFNLSRNPFIGMHFTGEIKKFPINDGDEFFSDIDFSYP